MKRNWWILFLIALASIILAVSCSTPAKTARQNQKAYQTVITDSIMFRSIGQRWSRLQPPCANDTVIQFISYDTPPPPPIDPLMIRRISDSLSAKADSVCKEGVEKAYTFGYASGYQFAIDNQKPIVKTQKEYITDNTAIQELQDSLHDAAVREARQDGRILQLMKDGEDMDKRAVLAEKRQKQLGCGIWGLLALLLITHGLRSIPNLSKLFKN